MHFTNDPYKAAWKAIDSLESAGLPRSALERVEKLYQRAKGDANPSQIIKTSLYRAKYLTDLEEDGSVKAIESLQGELAKADFPTKPILQSILGELYRNYLQSNYWRINRRTDTPDFKPTDLQTWSAEQLVTTSSLLYEASLQDERSLQVPLSAFSAITLEGKNTEGLWPTLYDFLTNRAIEYFSNEQTYLTSPAYKFYIDQEPAFADAGDFVKVKFTTRDTSSFEYKTLLLFQHLLARKITDKDPAAFIDVDLKRLQFVYNRAVVDIKDSLYIQALTHLRQKYSTHPSAAEAIYTIANWHFNRGSRYQPGGDPQFQWEFQKAKALCDEAIAKYPNSYGAKQCAALLNSLHYKQLEITSENVYLPGQPGLLKVQYRNIAKAYFKVVKLEDSDLEAIDSRNFDDLLSELAKRKKGEKWTAELPNLKDYQPHTTEVAIPALPLGLYAILASENGDFNMKKGLVGLVYSNVSNIAPIKHNGRSGDMGFLVVNRQTGAPMPGVHADFYQSQYNSRKRKVEYNKIGEAQSDGEGRLEIPFRDQQYRVKFTSGADILYPVENYYHYSNNNPNPKQEITHFFLDRAIYRPGQTVYFKAIVLEQDEQGKPSILANKKVTITFMDVNFQEVGKLDLVTNSYGTVNGSFKAPATGLLGSMSLQSSAGSSSHYFRVEEYKRPRFEVMNAPLDKDYQLGDKVTLTGTAQAYAGSVIDGAEVAYRVTREIQYPWFPWWRMKTIFPPTGGNEEMEIANGTTKTDAQGKYTILFDALPDRTADKRLQPYFVFRVTIDVTDITGETHSTVSTIQLGEVGLQLEVNVPEQLEQSAVIIPIATHNLNGEPQAAKGTATVFKLKSPAKPFQSRYWDKPDQYVLSEVEFHQKFPQLAYRDEDEPASWPQESQVWSQVFDSGKGDSLSIDTRSWTLGQYALVVKTQDSAGHPIEVTKFFALLAPQGRQLPAHIDLWHKLSNASYEPGEEATAFISTGGAQRYFYYEIEKNGRSARSGWLTVNPWQQLQQIVDETDRGNFYIRLVSVKDNRAAYWEDRVVVPWSNKQLKITYSTFRDKLKPGQPEEWQLHLSGPAGEAIAAEMVAGMYDASLDQFAPNAWDFAPYPVYYYGQLAWNPVMFSSRQGRTYQPPQKRQTDLPNRVYPSLNWFGFYPGGFFGNGRAMMYKSMAPGAPVMEEQAMNIGIQADSVLTFDGEMNEKTAVPPPPPAPQAPPAQVQVRRNLQETVFFFPQLMTDAQGNVTVKFTMNEALTRWKFMTFAHTTDLKYGLSTREVVTQKELMVLPNAPRFMREGDDLWFTAKVSNLTEKPMTGKIRLELYDALTMAPVASQLGLTDADRDFTALAGQSAPADWRLKIPVGEVQALTWRVIATAGDFSDGEENTLPVLTNRMLVTETLPLAVKGKSTETFHLENMKKLSASPTLQNHQFTLEYTSNPAWYAVQALPYLMEYPYECTEQIFSRYYANTLASSIANRYPKIKTVFEQWKNTPAMESNLSKNQELKTALLEDTPWVLQAQSEAQQKQQIGLLFDLFRMGQERDQALAKLVERQAPSGGLAWFPGGTENWYMTQYLLEGLGHLAHLGADDYSKDTQVQQLITKGFGFVDAEVKHNYEELEKLVKKNDAKWDDDHLENIVIHYLYTASFFPKMPHDKALDPIRNYYLGQAEKYWTNKGIYQQGMLALVLYRHGKKDAAQRIIRSLSERALHHPELGMYWKYDRGYYWYQLPVETHSLMIEVFAEAAKDDKAVDELKIWLLKNKQTNNWKTTKATAAAVYALLANGDNWLLEDQKATITFPDLKKNAYQPQLEAAANTAEAGTGYFSVSWKGKEVNTDFNEIKVKNSNKSIAWGAVYWQYFEDLDKIKTFEETPLQLKKQLFKEVNSDTGPVLKSVESTSLKPGDKLIVRIELRVDRAMEYVHLKDMRASGLEPINVLSQYKWQGGLGYYESTRDAATDFFIDYLPRGTYVFEYPLRVTHRGDFSNGISSIQCMYAPEFSSHSEGVRIEVK